MDNFLKSIDKEEFRNYIDNSVSKAQACQRNWDLSKFVNEKDLESIISAGMNCPSKQNQDFYNLHVITNRDIIQKLYESSIIPNGRRKNPQLLANAVILFESKEVETPRSDEQKKLALAKKGIISLTQEDLDDCEKIVYRDTNQSLGIAAGFINITSAMLGYETGFCACFDDETVKSLLDIRGKPLLAIGIGIKDANKDRTEDHITGELISKYKKGPIGLSLHK